MKQEKIYSESTDLEKENIKGDVCLIIEQDFNVKNGVEQPGPAFIFKFNRFGNLLSNELEKATYSYNENGNLLVKKKVSDILFGKEGFRPVATYWKYLYDNDNFVNRIDEYELSEVNLQSRTMFERNKYHYVTKSIKVEFKIDTETMKPYTDTITTTYKYNNGELIECKEFAGKRILKTTFVRNSKGLAIKMHCKDLVTYKDSTIYYTYANSKDALQGGKPTSKGFQYENINKNVLISYEYDENGNVIHLHICDSTNNTQKDWYTQYQYDELGNWTKAELYDNFHELTSYKTRRFEYYPKDTITGETYYNWENEISPLERQFRAEKIRKQKENAYLNDKFILEQFNGKMKEFPNYKVLGTPKIIFHRDSIYHINFNARHDMGYGYYQKENITVRIVINIDDDTFTFDVLKGELS